MEHYPKPVTKNNTWKIFQQMNTLFYKITNAKGKKGLGFFCYIKSGHKNIPVLLTDNEIINDEYNNNIDVSINNASFNVQLGDAIYKNEENNLIIVEIKEKKLDKLNIFEIDDLLYQNDSELMYKNESVYIMNYNKTDGICVSYGVIDDIFNSEIKYFSSINTNLKITPIFSLANNKLIGLHKSSHKYYNKGIYFKYLIKEYLKCYKHKLNSIIANEINISINIKKQSELNKEIYFLDNYKENEEVTPHNNLRELNQTNTNLYINDTKYNFQKYFKPDKLGKYNITLKFNFNMTDCSYMFAGCKNITDINFISFNTQYVINMKYMFYKCTRLTSINLLNFNTKNVFNMGNMFSHCYKLQKLDLSSFDTSNVTIMNNIFLNCRNLNYLNISTFNTKNVEYFENIFCGCLKLYDLYQLPSYDINYNKSFLEYNSRLDNKIEIKILIENYNSGEKVYFINLKELNELNTELYINNVKKRYINYFIPERYGEYNIKIKFQFNLLSCQNLFENCSNITNINFVYFNTKNVTDMSGMFNCCSKLANLDLSLFNTKNVTNMSYMFNECEELKYIDLTSFDTKNVTDMNCMFDDCRNLTNLDLSNFITKNVTKMSFMFKGCENLINLNVSSFDTSKVTDMDYMFKGCNNLNDLDLSNFDTKNVKDMSCMFSDCEHLSNLDISHFDMNNVKDKYNMFDDNSESKNLKSDCKS